jgi:alpha-glucosidase (family GH31 glycosyl hydrolase)
MIYTETFPIAFKPLPHPEAVVIGPEVRFTVLTSRLLRLEYSPVDRFEDRPSQVFWYRNQPVPSFYVRRAPGEIELGTEYVALRYTIGDAGFAADTLSIELKEAARTWHYGDLDAGNLGGTARTLDETDGVVPLEPGLLSREGWVLVDDSARLVFDQHGWLVPRHAAPEALDLYFFGYGNDYAQSLRDYGRVAGPVPLVPRWILGNWWSRYWAYTADDLLDLMHDFKDHAVPLGVCIVDMDWHITETGNTSSGWTGYTWNRALFPDPPAFIQALHDLGLRTALNLHPAAGVHPHEEAYPAMAERLGIDPATQEPIPFDIADPDFARAYFELLHHPLEDQGVDFWWVDWQQGTRTSVRDLDPLWWLNHLHYYDLGRTGKKRPFIFSRWGGLGNHRYPIGFSGDTVVSWESLALQPAFTARAANVAYGWWSHDIGGHMGGVEDAELFTRWVQFGVLSPIFRLHCTNNPYHERRPWGYDAETLRVTREAMQFRHALIPYLYTMAWRQHRDSQPLVRPMYHSHPSTEAAYHCPDQYTFGSELIAAPFISPADAETRLSRQVIWLPPGTWFDFFGGTPYEGDTWHALYGELDDVPLFARAGAIVPLAPRVGWGGVENPHALEIHLFPGADRRFELYEDDDLKAFSLIPLTQTWLEESGLRFDIEPAKGATGHLPAERAITLIFKNLLRPERTLVSLNGRQQAAQIDYDEGTATLSLNGLAMAPSDRLSVTLFGGDGSLMAPRGHRRGAVRKLLRNCQLDSWVKQVLDQELGEILADPHRLTPYGLAFRDSVIRALVEIVSGSGSHQTSDRQIMWNNAGASAITYRLNTLGLDHRPRLWQGPLPRFAVLLPGKDVLIVRRQGTGEDEQYRSDAWQLVISHLGLAPLRAGPAAGRLSHRIVSGRDE